MSNRTFWLLLLLGPMMAIATTVLAANQLQTTDRFTGALDCRLLDPPPGTITEFENVNPGDKFERSKWVTNTCNETRDFHITINGPNVDYIEVTSDDTGIIEFLAGEQKRIDYNVDFNEDTPPGFSAKDVDVNVEQLP